MYSKTPNGTCDSGGHFFDETEYLCKIIAYDEEEETLYLVSEEAELTSYSLDGIYECSIENLEDPVICKGIIKERYWNKAGKVMKFKIQNGFYKTSKLNRKCVDKPKRECYFISRIFQHSLLLSANNTENDLRRNRYEVSTIR